MKTSTKKKPGRRPFGHAADLADAYRELDRVLRRMRKRENALWPMVPIVGREVMNLSTHVLMGWENQVREIVAPVVAAARRVHAAKYGPEAAARYAAQLAREFKAGSAA